MIKVHRFWIVAAVWTCVAAQHVAAQTQSKQLVEYSKQFQAKRAVGRYSDANYIAEQMLPMARSVRGKDPKLAAGVFHNIASLYDDVGRYDEAVQLLEQSIRLYEQVLGKQHSEVALAQNTLGVVYMHQARFRDSEPLLQQALAIRKRQSGARSIDVAQSLNNLALLSALQGDFQRAKPLYEEALAIKKERLGANHLEVASAMNNLASVHEAAGNLEEAEKLLRLALAERVRRLPDTHPTLASSYGNLGLILVKQGRLADAEPLLKKAVMIRQETFGADHLMVAHDMVQLGALYRAQARFTEAEKAYRRAISSREAALGVQHPLTVEAMLDLASLHQQQGRLPDAETVYEKLLMAYGDGSELGPERQIKLLHNVGLFKEQQAQAKEAKEYYEKALVLARQSQGITGPDVARIEAGLARVAAMDGDDTAAAARLSRSIAIADGSSFPPYERFLLYQQRVKLLYKQGQKSDALKDLTYALELLDRQQSLVGGAEADRARAMAAMTAAGSTSQPSSAGQSATAPELLVTWKLEAGETEPAIEAADALRARTLLDQMQLRGADLLRGVPAEQAAELKRREIAAQEQMKSAELRYAQLKAGSTLSAEEIGREATRLDGEITQAREALAEVHRDIRSVSPAYRRVAGSSKSGLALADLQAWLEREKSLVLAYHIGHENSHVAVLAAGLKPQVIPLKVDLALADKVHCTPGPLTQQRLQAVLQVGDHGLLQLLARPKPAAAVEERLAELWKLLVPESAGESLLNGSHRTCTVVASGHLSQLPFECLVVEHGSVVRYLLDAGPPLNYAPSLDILYRLATREPALATKVSVVTLGDPVYRLATESGDSISLGSRYTGLGGQLKPLPSSGMESSWVADVFEKSGQQTTRLVGRDASEARVRSELPGRQIVHLACHGLADNLYGNLFGSLALTPGPSGAAADDGFLTLAEIYQLDATRCELAVLSACKTNFSVLQPGEGQMASQDHGEANWALSRGFLVAGARRVVASNWLVDDESAASLISYFCAGVAKDMAAGDVDFAQRLHDAKCWVRQQPQWNSPYHWGTFVLIGPR